MSYHCEMAWAYTVFLYCIAAVSKVCAAAPWSTAALSLGPLFNCMVEQGAIGHHLPVLPYTIVNQRLQAAGGSQKVGMSISAQVA